MKQSGSVVTRFWYKSSQGEYQIDTKQLLSAAYQLGFRIRNGTIYQFTQDSWPVKKTTKTHFFNTMRDQVDQNDPEAAKILDAINLLIDTVGTYLPADLEILESYY